MAETHIKDPREAALAALNKELGQQLRAAMPKDTGFALLIFDFGPGGYMTWASNASRPDMVRALREMATTLEGGGSA